MPEPRRGAPRWSDADPANDDEELPPWAGLAIEPRWADQQERPSRPGRPSRPDQPGPPGGQGGDAAADAPGRRPRGRLAAARARKTRRSLVLWGSVLAVAVVIAGGVWQLTRGASGTAPLPDQIVTTFLPGEFQTVPNTCTAVSTATLDQYLPGTRTKVVPSSLNGQSDSLCDWTLDARPVYRLLDVEAQAYAPNGLASGNGSATFSALQVTTAGGDTTDLLTVVIRDRNVLVTVVLEGLDHSSKGGYGPVSAAQLKAGALAVARDILAQVK